MAGESAGFWSHEHLYWFYRITADVTWQNASTYFLFAGGYWLVLYVLFRSRWLHRKIVARFPAAADMRRELAYSVMSLVIFAAVAAESWLLCQAMTGEPLVYYDLASMAISVPGLGSDGGWIWFVASLGLMIFAHDAYFYWTHRLLHHRRLFRAMHLVHHRSTNPTPFAAYSFSAWEALVQAGIFPLVAFAMPVHIAAMGIFMLWQIGFNVAGHCGYEFFPRAFLDSRCGKFLNTPTHHVMHHQHVRTNFGLYFNLWDRWLGTNDPHYQQRFAEVASRGTAPSHGAPFAPFATIGPGDEQAQEAA